MPQPASTPDPGPTPTGYQRTSGGQGFKWQPPTAEELGKLLPQYEIEALIGRGGMGAVYKGKQKALERPVAIKILPPEVDDEDASYTERFKNEAKIMARLEHPAIVPVYDFGETSKGQFYFVMGFINGTDIHQMIQSQGRLPPEHALAITAHVCDALRYAHEHGVVHRDIKPSNVLINMEGQVKVADFGLAKAQDTSLSSGITKTGLAMGTPDYVAPETLMLGVQVDGRADLYAVGVMLYQMLTGNVPRGAFKLPSVMIREIDPRFDAIVQKAMAYDREERYQAAAEIRRDLDVILTTPMVQTGGQSSAAIPQQSLPQKPAAKGPQKPMGKSAGVPVDGRRVRQNAEGPAGTPDRALASAPTAKSKTPLLIGLGAVAAIAVGAFVMLGGSDKAKQSGPLSPLSGTAVSSASDSAQGTVRTTLPPGPIKVLEATKPVAPPSATPSRLVAGQWQTVDFSQAVASWGLRSELPDKRLDIQNGALIRPPIAQFDQLVLPASAVIQTRVRTLSARSEDLINIGIGQSGGVRVQLLIKPPNILATQALSGSTVTLLAKAEAASPFVIGRDHQVELAFRGGKVIARMEGLPGLLTADLPAGFRGGPLYVNAPTGEFRDLKVMSLDGLPEAEALKILGVDEKGNDLRQSAHSVVQASGLPPKPAAGTAAPLSSSPSPQVSQSSDQKFPPGQWVKLFTQFEDLPENLRRPDSGVKFENGWIRFGQKQRKLYLPGALGANCAVRARALVHGADMEIDRIVLRRTSEDGFYQLLGHPKLLVQQWTKGAFQTVWEAPITPLSPGSEYLIEFAVVGGRLVGRQNDTVFKMGNTAVFRAGEAYIYGSEDIRDIEVVNLNGLPEAEALRIIGIDEKGNDLRALAAKQEQQMAEQAKAADAMAAIPELKTLHEQFEKLQAERVSAPFEKDLAALNTSYLGGLDRKIAEMKQKGDLDAVLALEAEKQLVPVAGGIDPGAVARSSGPGGRHLLDPPGSLPPATAMPIPADDEQTLPALKALRQIYRDAFAKLDATRAANLKLLTDPLSARLKQLETTLTQANRIEHAKTVREYREGLGRAAAPAAAASGLTDTKPENSALAGASVLPGKPSKIKPDPEKSRAAAEYALAQGCTVFISPDGSDTLTEVTPGQPLPKGKWQLIRVNFTKTRPLTDVDLETITQAAELRIFRMADFSPPANITTLAPFLKTPAIEQLLVLRSAKHVMTPDEWRVVATLAPTLESFSCSFDYKASKCPEMAAAFAAMKLLTVFGGSGEVDDEFLTIVSALPQLADISISPVGITDEGMKQLKKLPKLYRLILSSSTQGAPFPITAGFWADAAKTLGRTLRQVSIGAPGAANTSDIVTVLGKDYSLLTEITIRGEVTPEALASLGRLRNLNKLTISDFQKNTVAEMTHAHTEALANLKSLTELSLNFAGLSDEHIKPLSALKQLKILRIANNAKLTDACLPHLLELRNLTELILYKTSITSSGATQFATLKQLKTLDLGDLSVTDEDYARLKAALPDCTITR